MQHIAVLSTCVLLISVDSTYIVSLRHLPNYTGFANSDGFLISEDTQNGIYSHYRDRSIQPRPPRRPRPRPRPIIKHTHAQAQLTPHSRPAHSSLPGYSRHSVSTIVPQLAHSAAMSAPFVAAAAAGSAVFPAHRLQVSSSSSRRSAAAVACFSRLQSFPSISIRSAPTKRFLHLACSVRTRSCILHRLLQSSCS